MHQKNIQRFFLLLIIFAISMYQFAWSGTTGKITGIVTDVQTGEPLPGVNVLIEGTTMGAATNMKGYYVILNVHPGTYTLIASMIGYEKVKMKNVKVSVDLTTTINFKLHETVLKLGKEIVVTAERPIVTKDLTAAEANIDADRIANLPVQEVSEVLNLQSGVTVDEAGGIHIRGGRSSEVAYWIDGISVTDAYDGGISVEVENEAVQELQVISGTFNAEYGHAMSGIVNIVTKEGGEKLHGDITAYGGDYLSGHRATFYNIDDINPLANRNLQASLDGPVPFTNNKLTFYSTVRYYNTDGWLYGQRRFVPKPYPIIIPNPEKQGEMDTTYSSVGDSGAVPMNCLKKLTAQAKLTYHISPSLRLSIGALGSQIDYRDYNHIWRFNPDGDVRKFNRGYNLSFLLTHTLSSRTFYTINISNFYKEFREYLYKNPFDTRYVSPDSLYEGPNSFNNDGTNMHHFNRSTSTLVEKFDFTSQVTPVHQIKAGEEVRIHKLFLDEFYIQKKQDPSGAYIQPFQPTVLDISTLSHNLYNRKPIEFSAYVQDKIEFKSMIVNVGLRFDYFDARAKVLADPQDPNIYQPFKVEHDSLSFKEREKIWYKNVKAKYQLSPRFGIAYPITDRGVIHFSYGHFLQIPSFEYLYANPGYKVPQSSGIHGVYGNADLEPQRTVMYELGLQQQILEDIGVDITGFYRDVRNWVTTSPQIETAIPGVDYIKYINRDYANVRGITLSLNKRRTGFYSFDVQYTFQVAEGSNSDPNDEFIAMQNNEEPRREIVPLNWDQTHTLNVSIILGTRNWGLSLVGRYGSGYPYSPIIGRTSRQGRNLSTGLRTNSRRKPSTSTFDLRAYKNFYVGPLKVTFFTNVFNLFDRKNEVGVFQDTGRAGYTLQMKNIAPDSRMHNTLKEFFTRPDYYGAPRRVQVGVEVNF